MFWVCATYRVFFLPSTTTLYKILTCNFPPHSKWNVKRYTHSLKWNISHQDLVHVVVTSEIRLDWKRYWPFPTEGFRKSRQLSLFKTTYNNYGSVRNIYSYPWWRKHLSSSMVTFGGLPNVERRGVISSRSYWNHMQIKINTQ